MKILVVDNTILKDSWGSRDLVDLCLRAAPQAAAHLAVHVRRAPEQDWPSSEALRQYDGVVLSGSVTAATDAAEWVSRLDDVIRELAIKKRPLLGICYGHQSIARALVGKSAVGKAKTAEFGWVAVEKLNEKTGAETTNSLLKDLPKEFHSFSSHYDEVVKLPERFEVTARSAACRIQAFQMKDGPVFGVQFHPERDVTNADRTFQYLKSAGREKLFQHARDGAKYYRPEVGETIFRNFFKHV